MIENNRLKTKEVSIGDLLVGYPHPIRVQTMTTTDTLDLEATVAQCIRCADAGAELIRITAPSRKEAEALAEIRHRLHKKGYRQPLVADIHFTPHAAEIAARIVEKVRINPGNYADKKKFEFREYSDQDYASEISRIADRFIPLIRICQANGTAMRIGTNHGSLSDRIMSRYGDTPMGMVESALEFLRIAQSENYHQIVLSMKSSNPLVMVEAYRLLVDKMNEEFGEIYPLHLGVTEAGDGDDGRIKSTLGIGALLELGIGDTIRVSLTEDPEQEIPVCQEILRHYPGSGPALDGADRPATFPYYRPHSTDREKDIPARGRMGGGQVPVVLGEWAGTALDPGDLAAFGYRYSPELDKWHVDEGAADFIYFSATLPSFALPGTLEPVIKGSLWEKAGRPPGYDQAWVPAEYAALDPLPSPEEGRRFLIWDLAKDGPLDEAFVHKAQADPGLILCLGCSRQPVSQVIRAQIDNVRQGGATFPILLMDFASSPPGDPLLIQYSGNLGPLIQEGYGQGIWLRPAPGVPEEPKTAPFRNLTAFSILQASRRRISKTEYISCPSCGRTLFDLQETTARIRRATHHLKGIKIAIMGCIVNGPGEMADADFGYVGSGPGKITLYKGKEVVRRQIPTETAVDELIDLLKENQVWVEPGSPT